MRSRARLAVCLTALLSAWWVDWAAANPPPKPPAAAEELDEVISEGNLGVVTWRPVVWSFYLRGHAGAEPVKADLKADKTKESTPTDVGLWEWLEPQIRIRRRSSDQRGTLEKERDRVRADINKNQEARGEERDPDKRRQLEATIQQLESRFKFLEQQLQTGNAVAYAPEDRVLSGWKREFDSQTLVPDAKVGGDGFGTVTEQEAGDRKELIGKPHPVQQINHLAPGLLYFEPDILMTADPEFKDRVLREHFSVVSLLITAHRVPKGPSDPEDPAAPTRVRNFAAESDPKDPESVTVVHRAESKPGFAKWEDFPFSGSIPRVFEFRTRQPGLWEFRVVARVRGRLNPEDPFETKDVEGAIRVAFVKEGQFNVIMLNKDEQRK